MKIGHEMIFASAGSGKTHALTTRFIRLLAWGVPPERIAALTFTRKAAGEFFTEIVNRLAAAADADAAARRLAEEVDRPELRAADFARLLRATIGSMHRLNLGTLDGFFARMVRAFPLELGLGGEPAVLDERSAAEEIRRVLGQLFAARGTLTPEQQALIEAFKLATFGTEDKTVALRLDAFVAKHLALYRSAPDAERWGAAARIWPAGFPWGDGRGDIAAAAAALRAWGAGADLKEKQRQRWEDFVAAALTWAPGGPLPRTLTFVMEKALEAWDEIARGAGELKFDRHAQKLSREAGAALAALVRRIVALELGRRLAVTQGIAAVLRAFDARYDAEVRRAGRLTFADLQQLLAPAATARRLAMAGSDDEPAGTRLLLDYRMDARLDHWMFDEFQDTSFQQWQILEGLVDEVVHDPEGRRSFFYVGDVKQAIYTWREGDPRLFGYVASRYAGTSGGGVVSRELNDSWRSAPAVIEMVNRVCGAAAVLREILPEAADEWNRSWRDHRSARPERKGQAALLLAEDEGGRWAATLRLLQEIAPCERGLTCAVLVRTNETGARLADYLRREGGIAAVAEADLHIGTDNPVAAALAALLQAAAHPGDSLAQKHVAMTPLGELLEADGLAHPDAISAQVLRAVQSDGFAAWIESWARRLDTVLASSDAFSRQRLRQLVIAGQVFDESGSREVDAFLRFLAEYAVREPEGAGVVRVLTIHKSKGLGFDVVILPDLEGDKLAQRRKGPAVRKTADRAIDWVLEYPGELIAAHDPVLREYLREAVAENCYEQLSLLYVALTRAKYGLYAVIEPPGRSESRNFPRLLAETLGLAAAEVRVGGAGLRGTWSEGDPRWHKAHAVTSTAATAEARAWPPFAGTGRRQHEARTPSAETNLRVDAGSLFASDGGGAVEFGHAVHALLAEVEWVEDGAALENLARAWSARPLDPRARDTALACLRAPALAAVWRRRGGNDMVWRERGFELVLDQAWITGIFDRVVVARDVAGRALSATVFDFKTDRVTDEKEMTAARGRYTAQLEIYRRVAAVLLGLAPERVSAELVLTGLRRVVPVAGAREAKF